MLTRTERRELDWNPRDTAMIRGSAPRSRPGIADCIRGRALRAASPA
jgi:hypothetical protein